MITKKSSDLVTNYSQNFKDQEEVNVMKKEKEAQISRNLVLVLSVIHLQQHPYTHKEPFQRIQQMEDVWSLSYQRWSQKYCVIMTKIKDKLMNQDIGIRSNQYWWKRLHKKKHET